MIDFPASPTNGQKFAASNGVTYQFQSLPSPGVWVVAPTSTTGSGNVFALQTSPVFLGDPQAPTPTTADNDTSIATTAFVKTVVGGYVPLAGGNMTGRLNINLPGAGVFLGTNRLNAASDNYIMFQTAGANDWAIGPIYGGQDASGTFHFFSLAGSPAAPNLFSADAFAVGTNKQTAFNGLAYFANGTQHLGATSGGITVLAPAVAGSNTITWPALSGIVALVSAGATATNVVSAAIGNIACGTTMTAGATTGSVGASGQVWEIIGRIGFCDVGGGNAGYWSHQIWNGSAAVDAITSYGGGNGINSSVAMHAIVTLTGPTTFTLRSQGVTAFSNILGDGSRVIAKRLA